MTASILRCPICKQPLLANNSGVHCQNRHQFDRAKEGYLNLLPVQHKNALNPGDNQIMMSARETFLNSGHFDFLVHALYQTIETQCESLSSRVELLDIGCGEGFYSQRLYALLSDNFKLSGVDISKPAVRIASKRAKRQQQKIDYWVASNHRLPIQSQSVDIALKVFAPCDATEMSRCLKDDASFITVTPGARHLWQLKSKIYSSPQEHDEQAEVLEGFSLQASDKISQTTSIDADTMRALAQMTPFAWKISQDKFEQICEQIQSIEYEFLIHQYRKD